jgi:hypothetical protein
MKNRRILIIIIIFVIVLALVIFIVARIQKKKKEEEQRKAEEEWKRKIAEQSSGQIPKNAVGMVAYPKQVEGFVNVRSSAKINEGLINNNIGQVNFPAPIGKVVSQQVGTEDGKIWYKIKLTAPLKYTFSTYTEGFVRSDAVDFRNA